MKKDVTTLPSLPLIRDDQCDGLLKFSCLNCCSVSSSNNVRARVLSKDWAYEEDSFSNQRYHQSY